MFKLLISRAKIFVKLDYCNIDYPSKWPQWTALKHDSPSAVIYVTWVLTLSRRNTRLLDALCCIMLIFGGWISALQNIDVIC